MNYTFGVILNKSLSNPVLQMFPPKFSFRSVSVSKGWLNWSLLLQHGFNRKSRFPEDFNSTQISQNYI